MGKIMTRMGDGFPVEMSESEIRGDLEAGTEDAADRGKIAPLSKEELQYLYDLFASPYRFVGVEPGSDTVLKVASAEFAVEWVNAYGDVEPGEGLLHVDSYGQIAVAVRDGRAVESYPVNAGTAVTIRAGTPALRITPG